MLLIRLLKDTLAVQRVMEREREVGRTVGPGSNLRGSSLNELEKRVESEKDLMVCYTVERPISGFCGCYMIVAFAYHYVLHKK